MLCVPLGCMYAASPKVCRMFILYAHFHCVLVSPSSINDGLSGSTFSCSFIFSVVVVESGCQHSMPSNSADRPDEKSGTKTAKQSQGDCCILAVAAAAAAERIIEMLAMACPAVD